MAVLTRLFELMAQKKASDLFVSAGAPIHIKINGNTVPVNPQPMSARKIPNASVTKF